MCKDNWTTSDHKYEIKKWDTLSEYLLEEQVPKLLEESIQKPYLVELEVNPNFLNHANCLTRDFA